MHLKNLSLFLKIYLDVQSYVSNLIDHQFACTKTKPKAKKDTGNRGLFSTLSNTYDGCYYDAFNLCADNMEL